MSLPLTCCSVVSSNESKYAIIVRAFVLLYCFVICMWTVSIFELCLGGSVVLRSESGWKWLLRCCFPGETTRK